MKFIDAQQVHAALAYPALIEGLDRYHREDTQAMQDLLLAQPVNEKMTNHLFIRAAWQYDLAIGMKLVTIFPGNAVQQQPVPAIQAIYVLFDGANGTPQAAVDGAALTYRKTAADSALGASYLARTNCERMLMVGAGAMAPHLIDAHCAARPSIRHVEIWNRTPLKAETLAGTMELEGVRVVHADDLETAVRGADLICTATMSRQPLIQGPWLKPGAHLDLVGSFTPDMREVDDRTMQISKIFVDARKTTIGEVGEIMIPIETGVISEADIIADLYDLCRGRHPGRSGEEEITVFKNGGGGHLDLMTTRFLLERLDRQN